MKFASVLVSLVGVQQAIAAEQKQTRKLSNGDALEYLRSHPYSLPRHARIVMEEKLKAVEKNLQKRQSSTLVAALGALQNTFDSLGKPLPKATVADVQTTNATRFKGVNSIRKKMRSGPYRIPPVSEKNVEFYMLQATGMTNTLKIGAPKPCQKDCMLLSLQASLEDGQGNPIPNNPSGAWLHHVVLLNMGLNVKDATCGGITEHVFESGNERTDVAFYSPPSGVKSGYHVRNSDIFIINTELMNMEDKEKWVWLTLDYEYIEGFSPEWKEGKVVWMSVGPDRCTGSFNNPFGPTNLTRTQQPLKDKFEEYSVPWTSPKDGLILGSNSHLHDGGIDTKVYLEDKHICTSSAKYSKGPGGHAHGPAGHGGMRKRQMNPNADMGGEHISEQGGCAFDKPVPLKKGQSMYIKSDYDFTKHVGMKNAKGERDEVMAIAGALVAFDYEYWQSKR